MSPGHPDVQEIDPAAFERELREGPGIVVLDIRPADAFAAWHVSTPLGMVVSLPGAELDLGSVAGLGGPLRVVCAAGNASRRVAAALNEHGIDAVSVRGGMIAWSRVLRWDDVPLAGAFSVVQFRREARGCLSYLILSGGEALIVDPAPEVTPYLDEADRRGARITRVFDTHVHADHLSGARELAQRAAARLHLSTGALARGLAYGDDVDAVSDGDELIVGAGTVTVVALPGHTTDMTGLLVGDAALAGGDSIFADSVARPDLEAGDGGAADAARELLHTLNDRIAPLPDSTVLLPCHYAGGRLGGPLAPTLGEVRRSVPELALEGEAFVDRILGQMPPRPANFLAIIDINLGDRLPDGEDARLEVGANNCAAKVEWAQPVG
jgi:glyoxylase-like metal-dependent hydrolase (beta-lactamase superfamily II)